MKVSDDLFVKAELLGSLKLFTEYFYKKLTGRDFVFSQPVGRESHYITVMRELVHVFHNPAQRLLINLPPGHGKSTMLQYFVAWAMAHYPDSQFIYISYAKNLAEKHTSTIKKIMELSYYREIFGVQLSQESSAKGHFKTTAGGCIIAFGSGGGITGQDAGLPNQNRFSGAVIIDDAHKPDEVHSDTMRDGVITNYNETIKPRPRGENVPFIFLGQRLHEADLPAFLLEGKDGYKWKRVILKSIDEAGNALCPNINSLQMLRTEQATNPYVFSAQYQQDPQPAGGGIFKPEWFVLKEQEPEILTSFITVDSAETEKTYNDATVFSFWGLYRIKNDFTETNLFGLHWIDCHAIRVEPKDLKSEFTSFWMRCCQHKMQPKIAAIEKKSAGVTLVSMLKDFQGLEVWEVIPTKNKIERFLEVQPFVSSKHISLSELGKHTSQVIEHMRKITANNSHRFDDIADTCEMAIRIALIDKIIQNKVFKKSDAINAKRLMNPLKTKLRLKDKRGY